MKLKKFFKQYSQLEFEKYRETFIKNTLRRGSYRWPWRNIAVAESKVGRNQYRCAKCNNLVPNKSKKVDHKLPVVDPEVGFVNWDVYIKRLYCGPSNFQVLCEECHAQKTQEEREIRKATKARLKNDKVRKAGD